MTAYSLYRPSVAEFLAVQTVADDRSHVEVGELFKAYQTWCIQAGWKPTTSKGFGMHLTGLGIPAARTATKRYRIGLPLKV